MTDIYRNKQLLRVFWSLILICLLLTGCSSDNDTDPVASLKNIDTDTQLVSSDFNSLALDMLRRWDNGDNYVVTPLFTATTLSALRMGVQGQSRQQIDDVLGVTAKDDFAIAKSFSRLNKRFQQDSVSSPTGSCVWCVGEGPTLKESFATSLQENYPVKISLVSLMNEKNLIEINDSLSEATGGRIRDAIPAQEQHNSILVAQAQHQSLLWKTGFDADASRTVGFTLENGKDITASLMNGSFAFDRYVGSDVTCVFLPVEFPENLELWIIMPTASTVTDLISSVTMEQLADYRKRATTDTSLLKMPQVNITTSGSIMDNLKNMGITDLFSPDLINSSPMGTGLYIEALYSAFSFSWDNQGTATAQSGLTVTGSALENQIQINQPFLFLLMDRQDNDGILSAGVYRTPLK